MPAQHLFCEVPERQPSLPNHIVHVGPEHQYSELVKVYTAYCRKNANVSRETVPCPLVPGWPLTKCGVATSLPPVRSCNASPVWNAADETCVLGRSGRSPCEMRARFSQREVQVQVCTWERCEEGLTEAVGRDGHFDGP